MFFYFWFTIDRITSRNGKKSKKHKAGFIDSDSNVKSGTPLKEVIELVERTGHSTVTITEDGTSNGKFLGLVTDKDYRVSRVDLEEPIDKFMTPREKNSLR